MGGVGIKGVALQGPSWTPRRTLPVEALEGEFQKVWKYFKRLHFVSFFFYLQLAPPEEKSLIAFFSQPGKIAEEVERERVWWKTKGFPRFLGAPTC